MNRLFTEAEIFEAVCWAIGDDGSKAEETIEIINFERKEHGILKNEDYAKDREDFAKLMNRLHKKEANDE